MTIFSTGVNKIRRKKELLETSIEEVIKSHGWTHGMIGWYWIWSRSFKLKGKLYVFTALSAREAFRMEEVIQEMQHVISPEADPKEVQP